MSSSDLANAITEQFAPLESYEPCPDTIPHGFTNISIPKQIVHQFQEHVLAYFKQLDPVTLYSRPDEQDGNSLEDQLTSVATSFSDEEFVKVFVKGLRTFPLSVSKTLLPWIETDLKQLLGATRISLTHVSELDQLNNAALTPQDYDVYWRCVRPNKQDVASPHKDSQFAYLNVGSDRAIPLPFEYRERWRVWFPLFGCHNKNSLQLVKDSYKEDIPFSSIETANGPRPDIKKSWVIANEHRFECPISKAYEGAIFRDDVVHRGPPNKGPHVRLSAEFTILIL